MKRIKNFWYYYKTPVIICLVVVLLLTRLISSANTEYIREHAEARWAENGFTVQGYDGWEIGPIFYGSYGGASVWYKLGKEGNDITYEGALRRWGDELHVYKVRAIDAIRPGR